MTSKNPDTQEILETMQVFSSHMDEKFNKIDQRFEAMDKRFDRMDERIDRIETCVDKIETTMVTKDYLDERLIELQTHTTGLIRKEDNKMTVLVEILQEQKVITPLHAQRILSMEPFGM